MRISTAQMYADGIRNMQSQSSDLLHTEQQLATGQRMLTPADDPAGAVEALRLHERAASVDQYGRNADRATTRLGQEESALGTFGDALQRVRVLTVEAANGSQTDESRAAIAQELRQISASLLDTANSRDAGGEYLFAGFRSANQPFLRGPDGQVAYQGDGGERRVALAPDKTVAVGDSGQAFMTIPRGNGRFTVTPDDANTGTGVVAAAEVADNTAFTGQPYTLVMTAADAYEVRDGGGNVVANGTFAPGQGIDAAGMHIELDGSPAAGDSFAIEPAGATSIFSVVDDLAAALETPADSPASLALLQNRTNTALLGIDQSIGRVLSLRTGVGARMNSIDQQQDVNGDKTLRLKTALSSVEDLDYAKAISTFSMQQTALQAAQQTYTQVARLSLFDFLR